MRAYLTLDDQLVVRDAVPADALLLWTTLHELYLARRGPDPHTTMVPATTCFDVMELVNAFEGLVGSIRLSALRGFDDWRAGYVRTFELVARVPDRRAVFAHNDVVWMALLHPLAEQLSEVAPRSSGVGARLG